MPIYFCLIKFAETVHAGPLGFTEFVHEFAQGDDEAAAERAIREWASAYRDSTGRPLPEIVRVKVAPAVQQDPARYVFPEQIRGRAAPPPDEGDDDQGDEWVTVLDVAKARGAREVDGTINGAEFERVGLPIFGGCQGCGATVGAYNAYPSRTGYLRCWACIGDLGFASAEAFEAFSAEVNDRSTGRTF